MVLFGGCAWFYLGGIMVSFGWRAWFYSGGMCGFIQGGHVVFSVFLATNERVVRITGMHSCHYFLSMISEISFHLTDIIFSVT